MTDSRDAFGAVAALDEPTRRRLYDHVVRQAGPVGRDEAATALGLPRSTAAFHLDRLADEGLLDVVYERRTGRSGPGAGRPSKLYRRSALEVAVALPERRYDVLGELLAATLEEAERSGEPPRSVLARRAEELGRRIGASAAGDDAEREDRRRMVDALEAHGFEPRAEQDDVVLANCPFHALAQKHVSLLCGMNLHLLQGFLNGCGGTGLQARLDPLPGRCCVRLEPAPSP
ncbi:MAG: helix-turn-helix transcriptional regulator [Nocardioidaceae bacterium]